MQSESGPIATRRSRYILFGLVLLLVLAATACGGPPDFKGSVLENEQPDPNFQLTDQRGETVSLEQFRGKVVVLTFLYTNCPDVCPLITQKLKTFSEELGPTGKDVAILAVTVDPEHDTVARVRQYTDVMGMTGNWHFLVGERSTLVSIWDAYYAAPLQPTPTASGGEAANTQQTGGLHSAPIYLIDQQGRRRVLHTGGNVNVQDLLYDVKLLLE